MEVRGGLGLSSGAGGKGNQADIVLRGRDVGEGVGFRGGHLLQLCVPKRDDALQARIRTRRFQFFEQPLVAEREPDLRLVDDCPEFPSPQQRHRRDGDASGLDHTKPAGEHFVAVRGAEQHAVSGNQPQVFHEDAGDAVRVRLQLGVGPLPFRHDHRWAVSVAFGNGVVEQRPRAVERFRILEAVEVDEIRPLLLGREVVAGEGVEVCGHRVSAGVRLSVLRFGQGSPDA